MQTDQHAQDISARSALLALLIMVPAPSIGILFAFWIAPGTFGKIVYALGKVVLYGLPLVWLPLIDRQRYSLSKPRGGLFNSGFGISIALGLVISAAIWGVYLVLRDSLDTAALRDLMVKNGLDKPATFLAVAAYICLLNALLEEYVFRWFIFTRCCALMSAGLAVVVAAIIFTLHHIFVLKAYFDWPLTLLASFGIFLGGLAWSWRYHRDGSIWPVYVSHLIVDVAVMAIGWQLIFE